MTHKKMFNPFCSPGRFLIVMLFLLSFIGCTQNEKQVDKEKTADRDTAQKISALTAPTQFINTNGGKLAYRVVGSGKPLILCNRFRGTMDDWDPKFIDELAKDFAVTIFDYRGIGLSASASPNDSLQELSDIEALAKKQGYDKFYLGGWSHGGKAAQVYAARHPDQVNRLVLLGTGPLGKTRLAPEKIFLDYALKEVNSFDDEIVLFFEPKYEESRKAAKESHDRINSRSSDRSIYVTPDKFSKYFDSVKRYNEDEASLKVLMTGKMPMLALSGEHDIVFPIENWYDQTRINPNLQIIMLPKAGHGPQSQYPVLVAGYMRSFLLSEE